MSSTTRTTAGVPAGTLTQPRSLEVPRPKAKGAASKAAPLSPQELANGTASYVERNVFRGIPQTTTSSTVKLPSNRVATPAEARDYSTRQSANAVFETRTSSAHTQPESGTTNARNEAKAGAVDEAGPGNLNAGEQKLTEDFRDFFKEGMAGKIVGSAPSWLGKLGLVAGAIGVLNKNPKAGLVIKGLQVLTQHLNLGPQDLGKFCEHLGEVGRSHLQDANPEDRQKARDNFVDVVGAHTDTVIQTLAERVRSATGAA